MKWIFQKQIEYNTGVTTSTISRNTGWLSPTNIKQSLDINRTATITYKSIDEMGGSQSYLSLDISGEDTSTFYPGSKILIEGTGEFDGITTVLSLYTNNITVDIFYDGYGGVLSGIVTILSNTLISNPPTIGTNYTTMSKSYTNTSDYEPKPIWYLETGVLYLVTPNTNDINKLYDTPDIISWGFNINVPTTSKIKGIEVKVNKSDNSYNSRLTNSYISSINPYYREEYIQDKSSFDSKTTNYTYDRVVAINSTSSSTYLGDNKKIPYTSEIFTTYSPHSPQWENFNNQNEFDYFNPMPNFEFGYTITPPTGIWTNNTYVYGSPTDNWSNTLTPDIVNNPEFSVIFGATQKVFKGYTYMTSNLNDLTSRRNWYTTRYMSTPYSTSNGMSYQSSVVSDIQIRVHYLLDVSGYTLIDRPDIFSSGNTLKTNDTYFKFESCFNGICYNYVKDVNNIYDISLMTGDGNSINNMYNEYNIIDEYMPNIYEVDIATKEEIDFGKNYFFIDNIKVKPGHLILLLDQSSATSNDIYRVNDNYFLENSNILSSRTYSYRAKVYVKLGTYKGLQYFLRNEGNNFPIINENKYFNTGVSYMVKNQINYNIFNSYTATTYSGDTLLSNPSKILFTDYQVARTLAKQNWSSLNIVNTSEIKINYLDNSYTLTSANDRVYYSMTGTSLTPSSHTMFNWSGHTVFKIDSNFYNISNTGDSILVSLSYDYVTFETDQVMSSGSIINYFTTIKSKDVNYLTISGEIPGWVFTEIYTSGYNFKINNLQHCSATTSDFEEYLNVSPYNEVLNFSNLNSSIKIEPKKSDSYKWFDYTLINITTGSSTFSFRTNNTYQNYKLKPFLDQLGTVPLNVYNDAFMLSGSSNYKIEEIVLDYDLSPDGTLHVSGGSDRSSYYYLLQSSMYKITPLGDNISKLKEFKPYTYIDFGISSKHNDTITPYTLYNSIPIVYNIVEYLNISGKLSLRIRNLDNSVPDSRKINSSTGIITGSTQYDGTITISNVPSVGEVYIESNTTTWNNTGNTGATITINYNCGSGRTLIYEVTDEYMIIEKPRIDYTIYGISSGNYDFVNVSKIQDISDLLYDVYLNYPHSYYFRYPDNIRTKICSQYGLILKDNEFIRNVSTGIIYQKNDLFNFDLFNIEIDSNYNHLNDVNLYYKPIEMIYIGSDKKTKLPIPLDISNIDVSSIDSLWYTGYTHI